MALDLAISMQTVPAPELRYLPDFVAQPEPLFLRVRSETSWDQRMVARWTASVGFAYNYSGIFYPDAPMPEFLGELAAEISRAVAHPINNCLANLLRLDHILEIPVTGA